MSFLFRPVRGGLAQAMAEVVELQGATDLLELIIGRWGQESGLLTVEPYTYDGWIQWDTHLVCFDGCAVG